MHAPKILVAYYSRTGCTRTVAERLQRELNCDLEEIIDLRPRTGPIGYVRSGLEALLRRIPNIVEPRKSPADYDLVVVATPEWAGTLSSPARSYLTRNRDRFHRLAFVVTHASPSPGRALEEMGHVAGTPPVAMLDLDDWRVQRNDVQPEIAQFARQISAVLDRLPPEQLPLRPVIPPEPVHPQHA